MVSEARRIDENVYLDAKKGELALTGAKQPITTATVLSAWGPADFEGSEGRCKVWGYHREQGFSGVIPWLILPIPLLVPSGSRDTLLFFIDDSTVAAAKEFGGEKFIGCGIADTAGCSNTFQKSENTISPTGTPLACRK